MLQLYLILFENQSQTMSTSPCLTLVMPSACFLVFFLIFIEYEKAGKTNLYKLSSSTTSSAIAHIMGLWVAMMINLSCPFKDNKIFMMS